VEHAKSRKLIELIDEKAEGKLRKLEIELEKAVELQKVLQNEFEVAGGQKLCRNCFKGG
jgi:hypothetical protein